MKTFVYKTFFSLLCGAMLFCSCKDEVLNTRIPEQDSLSVYPEFNFNIESVAGSDTVAIGDTIFYNLYLRQQLTYVANRKYFVSFRLPQSYDGEAFIYGAPWRSNDKVEVKYDQVLKDNYRVGFYYHPRHTYKGNYTLDFIVTDESGKQMSFAKSIIVK